MRVGNGGTVRFNYHSPSNKNTSDYMMHLIPQPQPTGHVKQLPPVLPNAIPHSVSPRPVQRVVSPNRKKLQEVRQQQYGHPVPPRALQRVEAVTRMSQQKSTLSQASENRSVRSISQKEGQVTIELQEDSPPPKIVVTQKSKGSVLLPQVMTQQNSQISMQGRPRVSSSLSNYSSNTVRVQQPASHLPPPVTKMQVVQGAPRPETQIQQIAHCVETIEQQTRPATTQYTHTQTYQDNASSAHHQDHGNQEMHMVVVESPEHHHKQEHSFYTPAQLLKEQMPGSSHSPKVNQTPGTPHHSHAYGTLQRHKSQQAYAVEEDYAPPPPQHYYSHSGPFFQSQQSHFDQRQRRNYHQRNEPQYEYYRSQRSELESDGTRRSGLQCHVSEDVVANQRRLVNEIFESETQRALFKMSSIQRQHRSRRKSIHRRRI